MKHEEWLCDGCTCPVEPVPIEWVAFDQAGNEVGRYHFHEDRCIEMWAVDRQFRQRMESLNQAVLARQSTKEN